MIKEMENKIVIDKSTKRISNKDWISTSKTVFDSYEFRITLRQLFYVLVSKGFIEKTENRYKSLSRHLVKGRKKGEIEWNSLIDSTREITDKQESYFSIKRRVNDVISYLNSPYTLPVDFGQKILNIFYLEKDSLKPFIVPHLYPNSILVIGKGFNSWSNAYELGRTLSKSEREIRIYTLVDYDQSGTLIHNSFVNQLDEFNIEYKELRNIAITEYQIGKYKLPPHKGEVQLQALDPMVLRNLIIETCNSNWNEEIYQKRNELQEAMNIYYRKKLEKRLKENGSK